MESIKWGKVLATTKDCIAEKETLTFRLLDQIQQLYGVLCCRAGIPQIYNRNQVEEQLDMVKDEIEFFREVISNAKQLMANEKKSNVAVRGSEKKAHDEH